MSRPLSDIVAELEAKYGECALVSLEERARLISEYDASMDYLLQQMDNYVQQVNYSIEHKLNITIVSRITENLIFLIAHVHDLLVRYSLVVAVCLVDERYDENYHYWKEFDVKGDKIMDLIENLNENSVFNSEDFDKDEALQYYHIRLGFDNKIPPQVEQEMQLAGENGPTLLACLEYMLEMMAEDLDSMKMTQILRDDELLKEDYEINYLLYATTYWPAIEQNFRSHVSRQILRGKVSVNALEKLRRNELMDFEYHSDVGKLWRDNSENIVQLALQMKNANLKEEQWKYFFRHVFELEEYDRWIEELENASKSKENANKQKNLSNASVLTENKEFMKILQKASKQGFCSQQGWQYIWKVKVEAAYFASVASRKFKLSNRKMNGGKENTVSWIPFEALFAMKGLKSSFNDYKQCKTKLVNEEKIDKLFK